MSAKKCIVLLFGGQSCEHEISVTSASCVYAALDQERYSVILIGITKAGKWLLIRDPKEIFETKVVSESGNLPVTLDFQSRGKIVVTDSSRAESSTVESFDLIFPILHGPYGEDGTIQGLLELSHNAYIGSGVTGSAAGMDKSVAKAVCTAQAIPQAKYDVYYRSDWENDSVSIVQDIESKLRYPLFIKPCNLGSSVGISKVQNTTQLIDGINFAAKFDLKIIVEEGFENCHEIEVSVLGNDHPKASVIGELIPAAEFYDYDDKYINDATEFELPAKLPEAVSRQVQEYAVRAFKTMAMAGLARVDFFVHKQTHEIYLNEINTMPGFTPISMYPKLWQASGLNYADLIQELIQLALRRRAQQDKTQYTL